MKNLSLFLANYTAQSLLDHTFYKDRRYFGLSMEEREMENVKVRSEVKSDLIFGCKL